MTTIMIFHVRSKYTAVGRKEIITFFYLYMALTVISLILDSGVVPLASVVYPYFVAVQCGLSTATCWCLLVNGFVGFQFAEDGTPLSLWVLISPYSLIFLTSAPPIIFPWRVLNLGSRIDLYISRLGITLANINHRPLCRIIHLQRGIPCRLRNPTNRACPQYPRGPMAIGRYCLWRVLHGCRPSYSLRLFFENMYWRETLSRRIILRDNM